jgi:glycosyltransferase involved in cell wall biosynthesis
MNTQTGLLRKRKSTKQRLILLLILTDIYPHFMRIAFVHSGHSFLPEIEAYKDFFAARNIETVVTDKVSVETADSNVEWHFMGQHFKRKKSGRVLIHEYTSSSVPPFAGWKNLAKKFLNCKPDYRLFLNDRVKNKFGFADDITSGIRDMGVAEYFFLPSVSEKKDFDFIYTGDTSAPRRLKKLLDCFTTGNMKQHSLLILSRHYNRLAESLKPYKNIRFAGPVPYKDVPGFLSKARFAINFIPDIEPFNEQTSTKVLEYCAAKIPVVSTNYRWVNTFIEKHGASFFLLNDDLSNFTWENVCSFTYQFPDLSGMTWEKQILQSGIMEFLQSKFPGTAI